MRLISARDNLETDRGAFVVCVLLSSVDDRTLVGIRSVVATSDASAPILLAGPAECLERLVDLLDVSPERVLFGMASQGGEAAIVNEAMRAAHPADVVLVAAGTAVSAGWLPRLRAAAESDSTVASATPLSIGAGEAGLFRELPGARGEDAPERSRRADGEPRQAARSSADCLASAAQALASRSLRLWPRVATMEPGCLYVRRTAWELAGPLEDGIPLREALEGMARRASGLGMVHVLADDVVVAGIVDQAARFAASEVSSENPPAGERKGPQAIIACDEQGPLRRSLSWGRATLRGLSVTIDGRALTSAVGGTQTYVIGVILALARERRGAVRVLVAPDMSRSIRDAIAGSGEVELLSYDDALRDPPLTDVVHRPQQVFTPDDLALLRLVGRRIVIGQQDLIAYHNYTYHSDIETWQAYRRTTRLAMAGADQVIFFSEHARRDALAESLLPERRTHVVGIGGDMVQSELAPDPPAGVSAGDRFLLCLGADYAHKNRPFAIRLMQELNELGWDGRLVLAGSHVPYGSSREREAELLRDEPALAARILDLGPIAEAPKQWLYAHARALLYPTVYEGFGLIPQEAAHAGLPCLFAPQASLSEIAPGAATLTPWDARGSAAAVLPLLSEGVARSEHLKKLRSLPVPTWHEVAQDLLSVYEQALAAPPPGAAPRAWQELDRENHIIELDRDIAKLKEVAREYQDAYHRLDERVEFGLPLIDSGGGLLSQSQQRGLMRIASRGRLGALVLAPFGLLGRGGSRGRDSKS
jgi:glycosyltransferase involved in cell wall biosynthesis